MWEDFAQDRTQWRNHLSWWIQHWVQEDAVPSFEYLQERQPVVVRTKKKILDCFLRPSKDFTEVPYTTPFHVITPGKISGAFIWTKSCDGRCAVAVANGRSVSKTVVVHVHAGNTCLDIGASLLRLSFKIKAILALRGIEVTVFCELAHLQRAVFHRHVPLTLLPEATEALNLLDGQGIASLKLPPKPKSGSVWQRMINEAMALEDMSFDVAECGIMERQQIFEVCRRLLQECEGSFTCGAFVRYKTGIRTQTKGFPETVRLLAAFMRREFPGSNFMAMQVQLNQELQPHKDVKNTALPTLICNLSPGAPGGTWVEHPEGTIRMLCADGLERRGHILSGTAYKLSARQLWHASVPAGCDRMLLIGWVPAGGGQVQLPLEDFGICRKVPGLKWAQGALKYTEGFESFVSWARDLDVPTLSDVSESLGGWRVIFWATLMAVVWVNMARQVYKARLLMARLLHTCEMLDNRLTNLETSGLSMTQEGTGVAVPREIQQILREVSGQHNAFLLACEDVRSVLLTAQHACDMIGSQDKTVDMLRCEHVALVQSHEAMTQAVNHLLDATHDGPAPSGSRGGDKEMMTLLTSLVSGMDGLNKQLADKPNGVTVAEMKPVWQAIKDFGNQLEGLLKPLRDVLKDISSKQEKTATAAESTLTELKQSFGSKDLQHVLDATKGALEKLRGDFDRLEQLTRAKSTSIFEEVGMVKGQANSLHTTSHGLLRKLDKVCEGQDTRLEGIAGGISQLGSAFARLPAADAGVFQRMLDQLMAQAEMIKEQEQSLASTKDLGEVSEKIQELRDKYHERLPYRHPPPDDNRPQPRVIDLQSRVPMNRGPVLSAPTVTMGPGLATVTFSDGSRTAVRDEELRPFFG
ncbi:unnamed protein product [Symbiodinium sp. CCMP2456]|nr:unnamed protein product [Symbiodinium sp. CCMP2456]